MDDYSFLGEGDDNFSMGGDYPVDPGYGDIDLSNMDPITSDPSLDMVTNPADEIGNYGMDPSFTDPEGNFDIMNSPFGKYIQAALAMAAKGNNSGINQLMSQFPGLSNVLGQLGKMASAGVDAAQLGMYIKQSKDLSDAAKQYKDLGEQAANRADPFGPERAYYAQRLKGTYTDPQGYLSNDPTYNFLAKQGLAGLAQRAAGSGDLAFDIHGLPVGTYNKDIVDYAQGLASKTLNDARQQFASLAGSQFNPGTAAGYLMQGGQLQQQTQAQANANIGAAIRQGGQVIGDLTNPTDPGVAPPPLSTLPQPADQTPMTSPPNSAGMGVTPNEALYGGPENGYGMGTGR